MSSENPEILNLKQLKQTRKDQYAFGRSLRKNCSRASHGKFQVTERNVAELHIERTRGRIEELLPIRYQRILESPFTHYRGAAGIMAADLGVQKSTALQIQICGDCHLMNFGGFATPERNIIFDINDFDETAVAPWEWDLKRLAASFTIAARHKGFSKAKSKKIAEIVVSSYAKNMRKYAEMSALQVWYEDIRFEDMIKSGNDTLSKKLDQKRLEKASERTPHEKEFEKMTEIKDGKVIILDHPPLIYHLEDSKQEAFLNRAENAFLRYKETLPDDRKVLLENYKIQDVAVKVVGVGSVGTWCGVILLLSDSGDPLFLQFKEAYESVLTPFTGKSEYEHHGQRVVNGQRLMQSASDIFLGWTSDNSGRNYYVRQMRDAKIKPVIETMNFKNLVHYASSCGWALAQAHARTGKAAAIAGYIGKSDKFKKAISRFSVAYTKQNKKDYYALLTAVEKGIIKLE
ncbi:DUF2252 domain-containing protein [Flavobacterium reichenbachii]|uniref:DUF2252 domain-containing protein n=1 Tax=Flavobacterium reichenbachii TaxID=362418 RepID=A0A085ZEQ6_9FLAO|nr:DUF2252 domain-containing protein [Flavobacterium reichenbachii]KFF02920.1 hypothetical protein IW19_22470 [Flavobacterium reichenbachii]OXB16911.1 hypothetical protein B0A68_05625 [Flavobacterium reichenbachii]